MAQAFFGGVHPNDMKAATNEKAIEQLSPPPAQVVIPMSMHFGAPCTPIVSVGDYVKVGQKIGEFKGLGAPIHASVSGKVVAIEPRPYSMGGNMTSVVIENDYQNTVSEEVKAPADPNALTTEEMIEIVKNAGIVGMGGATFPTHVKISGGIGQVTTVIINGAECEPYITSDTRTMLDRSEELMEGARLVQHFLQVRRVIFAIEDNKPRCIQLYRKLTKDEDGMEVCALKSLYPQGGEKVLIYNTIGEIVPEGKLPLDVGAIVLNCTTLANIARYCKTGMPLVEKCITVDGSAVKEPKNLIVPIGTPVGYVIEQAGGFKCEPGKVILGGPMMGKCVSDLNAPVIKATNAVLAFDKKDSAALEPTPCIHCGRCVSNCPLALNPTAFAKAIEIEDEAERYAVLTKEQVSLCMSCGCCSYVCPAHRPLVDYNSEAKSFVRKYKAALAEKEGGK